MATAAPAEIDVFDPRVYKRGMPYEDFALLQREAPVSWQAEPSVLGWPAGPGFWAVVRHEDVLTVNRQPKLFSSNLGGTQLRDPDPEDLPFVRQMMLNMDPPEHGKLRRILNRGFTPRAVESMREFIETEAKAIVDRVVELGECDFSEDIGADLPLITLAELMGVPRKDRRILFDWANRIIGYQDEEYADDNPERSSDKPLNPRSREALTDMFEYAHAIAEDRRRSPADDIITKLLFADEKGERGLTNEEFENMFFLFAVAGNETLRSAIPGGMLLLIQHPDQRALLCEDLEERLPNAVEEMLRCHSPVIHFRRTATEDTELGGQQIQAGEKVVVYYAAANRDPEVFQEPGRFDIFRENAQKQVAFGMGPHFCLGAGLARLQMRVMFTELLTRIPDMELAGDVERLQSNFINGIKHMPVRYTPVAGR